MKNVILLVFVFLFISCRQDEGKENFVVDIHTGIHVNNRLGLDILDPDNPDSIKEEDVKLYALVGSEKKPHEFSVGKRKGMYAVSFLPYNTGTTENTTMYIQLQEGDLDTIKFQLNRLDNKLLCTKVWFNGELKWEAYKTERFFTVVK